VDVGLAEGVVRAGGEGGRADPFDGRPVPVKVWTAGRQSWLFGELENPPHARHLLVVAELPGGRRVGTVADIPDFRRSREMTVTLP
jgi:hypothetical protein